MNGCTLEEAPYIERLLGLKFTADLKWNYYMTHCLKRRKKKNGPLIIPARFYLTLPRMLDIFFIIKAAVLFSQFIQDFYFY